ncbi:hypothetical protein VOLCADRAFT_105165 [Volvox carteri f. nagariensis]|uniref:Sugar phosphate transporter domain-containing protein n=1 Tax=Volvox carteri f. nagariensis TaxID=3068 RepID=D8TYU5_VOLCA|nr:uncharacterized protein VOLCADRAFT_105165 [Volvox carteri f. nagariensis]EFJ47374.1 hypothetical protein VOLCADRAFT_105165 [Volvox carteri f. nagariensis]|eukprot:XP_002951563.1 hypothetical protein VOLCADRAFT_105165 [Volvox carteri f. nagariensis]
MSDKERGIEEEKAKLLEGRKDVEAGKHLMTSAKSLSLGGFGLTSIVILYYAICSSTMLVINKVAIYHFPCPISLLCLQLFFSAFAVTLGHYVGVVSAEAIDFDKLKKFVWVVVGFLGTIFANIKVLQHANVETFITFRSTTPLILSICDYIYLGRALPTMRSWLSLVVLLSGSFGYVLVDSDFKIDAYYWLLLWYAFFTFDTVYVKHMCETVKMTNWSRVYYTNAIALGPLLLALPLAGEQDRLSSVVWTSNVWVPVLLSCLMGICMSHSAYLLRDTVSATLFTIVGILCKIITVVINVLIWDKHATPAGIGFLLVCVFAGTFYEQAPKRAL